MAFSNQPLTAPLVVDLTQDPGICQDTTEESVLSGGTYSDGYIVAKILSYPESSIDARQWWERLDKSKSKPRVLKKILKHPTLAPTFKKVLQIPGMRSGLLLATWKIFQCVEV
jgi:hypothetical protein